MNRIIIIIALIFIYSTAKGQIPVEIYGGDNRATVDIMFFKFFKNSQNNNSRWLFFNRNRASIDYKITSKANLPIFGFTEAVSFNHEKLKGIAPVLVGQVLSWGVYSKAGIQYAHNQKEITIFTWFVSGTNKNPDLDYFILFRYTPEISRKVNLFTQLESVNAFPTKKNENLNLTQRLRLGIQLKSWQFGAGADFNQIGNSAFVKSQNIGCFLRHEF